MYAHVTCVKPLSLAYRKHIKENLPFYRLQLKLKSSTQFPPSELSFPTSVVDHKAEALYAVPNKLKKV